MTARATIVSTKSAKIARAVLPPIDIRLRTSLPWRTSPPGGKSRLSYSLCMSPSKLHEIMDSFSSHSSSGSKRSRFAKSPPAMMKGMTTGRTPISAISGVGAKAPIMSPQLCEAKHTHMSTKVKTRKALASSRRPAAKYTRHEKTTGKNSWKGASAALLASA